MKLQTKQTVRIYWNEIRRYKLLVFAMVFSLGVATTIEVIIPIYYRRFFNLLSGTIVTENVGRELLFVLFFILGLNIVAWAFFRVTTFGNDYFQPRVMTDLLQHAYEYLQGHSYGFFSNRFVGALVRKVTRLSRAFEVFADRVYWNLFPLSIRITGAIVVLYLVHHTIAYILLAWTAVFIVLNYFFSLWKLPYDTKRAAKDTETTATLADAVTNQVNVQLFTGQRFEARRFENVTDELRRLRTWTWNLGSVIEAVQAVLFIGVEFLLMYLAIQFWQEGRLTIGDFVLIQSYLLALIGRLWDVGKHIRDIYESFADAEEMTTILVTPHEIRDAAIAKALLVPKGKIEFRDVCFSFHKTRRVLHHIQLVIRPKEKVAFIGPSGAGKSTMVKLLFRFYDLDQGKIFIDDQKINYVTQNSLRSQLSLVPQEPILFHRTIMENIRYGRRDATDEEVVEASRLAHCHEFIQSFPDQYNTFVGERGIKLSGGERQRIAIARAMLKNAPILVLDEATSSLDSYSETLIQDALKHLMKKKTVIVIAHRLSTIRQMDRIIVFEHGRLVSEGSHEILLKKNPLYKKLWTLQAGGFLPDLSEEE